VVCSPHGVGKIVGTESKTGCECLAITFASGLRAFIPVDNAARMLKPLASHDEARTDLEILRGAHSQIDRRNHREVREERERILKNGTSAERATVLRGLYAAKAPISDSNASAIRAFEDSVLEEISIVLGIPRSDLEGEMRERYPVFAKRKRIPNPP
jgi:RNA polymerase-interacting CarD/CdnL/TRCF family regulator